MFERFTDDGRRVIVIAQEEARLLHHSYIGTEHILLALATDDGGGGRVLRQLGLSYDSLRAQVIDLLGPTAEQEPRGNIPFTPRAKKVLELSLREVVRLGHKDITSEHLLLGLMREGEGVAVQAIANLGVEPDDVIARALATASDRATPATSSEHDAPRCSRCGSSLAENAGYRVVEATSENPDVQTARFVIVFCRACGTALGTAS